MGNSEMRELVARNLKSHFDDIGGRSIVILGADEHGKLVLDVLDELRGEDIAFPEASYFVDKDPERQYVDFEGFEVYPLRTMSEKSNAEYIILAGDFAGIIINELDSLGYGLSDYCRSFSELDERAEKKIAVITGSTKGIGRSTGIKLLEEGCQVVFHYGNDDEAADLLSSDLKERGFDSFDIVKADLTDEEGLDGLIDYIKSNYTHINYLILNASVAKYDLKSLKYSEITRDKWNRTLNGNLSFNFFLMKDLDHLIRDNGRIVLISSAAAKHPVRNVAYGASKAGVSKLVIDIMPWFAKRGITCNAICPSIIYTGHFHDRTKEVLANTERRLSLKRMGQPAEVASLVLHVLHNPYLTGTSLDCGFFDTMLR